MQDLGILTSKIVSSECIADRESSRRSKKELDIDLHREEHRLYRYMGPVLHVEWHPLVELAQSDIRW